MSDQRNHELEQQKEDIKRELREKIPTRFQYDNAGNKTNAVLSMGDYEFLLELCARGGIASGLLEAFLRMQEEQGQGPMPEHQTQSNNQANP